MTACDVVVVGAGPNGLAAAITMARAGRSVLLVEAEQTVGGGCRSAALTLPGFVHDVCSAVHPMALASPFFQSVPLADHGVVLDHPPVPLAHPLDGGRAVALDRDLAVTGGGLGGDGAAWARLFGPLVDRVDEIVEEFLAPPLHVPRHPVAFIRFGLLALRSATRLATSRFGGEPARALLGGIAAHTMVPLDRAPTGAVGLLLGMLAHAYGWPVVRGGSQRLTDALAAELLRLGGEIRTGWRVGSLDELPDAGTVLLDLTPRQVLAVAGDRLPARYRRALGRFRYGPGVFKMDWALDGPIPWTADVCARAGTLHLGGGLGEIAAAEDAVAHGRTPTRPFVLLSQPGVADPTRAPAGRHTVWAYCHVPNGSTVDMSDAIERQIERFAPGFRDRVLARSARGPAAVESHNANYIGGDINGGLQDLRQLLARPVPSLTPYATPNPHIWLCSSSTPPGGGVHGMSGALAAQAALHRRPAVTWASPRLPPTGAPPFTPGGFDAASRPGRRRPP